MMCLNTTGYSLTLVEPRSPHWRVLYFSFVASSHVNTSLVWHWITNYFKSKDAAIKGWDAAANKWYRVRFISAGLHESQSWYSSTVLWNNKPQKYCTYNPGCSALRMCCCSDQPLNQIHFLPLAHNIHVSVEVVWSLISFVCSWSCIIPLSHSLQRLKWFTVVDSETDPSQPALINDACTQSH